MVVATPAVDLLVRNATAHRLHEYRHEPGATSIGRAAAAALAAEPDRVFKTLVVVADGELVVAVVPVSGELDVKAFAAAIGAKRVAMADRIIAERATGYVVGGISPLGQKRRLPTVVDQSAERWPTVFVSGGRRGLEIELAPGDLVSLTGGKTAVLARSGGRGTRGGEATPDDVDGTS